LLREGAQFLRRVDQLLVTTLHGLEVSLQPGECIQVGAVVGDLEQKLMFMLAMQINEQVAQLSQNRQRHRGIVDEAAALAGGMHLAAHQQALALFIDLLPAQKGRGGRNGGDEKLALDHRLVRSAADHLSAEAVAQQGGQSADEDRFARAGLAGDDVQPRREANLEFIDEEIVFGVEKSEHALVKGLVRRRILMPSCIPAAAYGPLPNPVRFCKYS